MLTGLGPTEGLVERLLVFGLNSDAAWLAGIAVVVGIMLWAAGARAVSLAFAAAGGTAGLFAGFALAQKIGVPEIAGLPGGLVTGAGGAALGVVIALVAMRLVIATAAGATAAAAAAGLAILVTPYLPDHLLPGLTESHAQVAIEAPSIVNVGLPGVPSDAPQTTNSHAFIQHANRAWQQIPDPWRGHATIGVLAAGFLAALLAALWPGRVASATTAYMGAAIWPLGALQMQAAAGAPLPISETPAQTWLLAWLILGIVGLVIQRLVVRKVADQ